MNLAHAARINTDEYQLEEQQMPLEWNLAKDVTIGISGAAGDGQGRTGDTLARTASRLGLHVYAYNSYQSIIRGGT